MILKHYRVSGHKGFTIVELMISTAVFTSILLVVLTAVTQIGRMYYKGIASSRTQEASRTIVDRISQEIQYSPTTTSPRLTTSGTLNVLCIGKSRFFYVINQKKTAGTYGLWTDESADGWAGCNGNVAALSALAIPTTSPGAINPREMLPDNARLVAFDVSPVNVTSPLYTVKARVVYGDDDLIDYTAGTANATCKGATAGTQFCGMSELTITVTKRL